MYKGSFQKKKALFLEKKEVLRENLTSHGVCDLNLVQVPGGTKATAVGGDLADIRKEAKQLLPSKGRWMEKQLGCSC